VAQYAVASTIPPLSAPLRLWAQGGSDTEVSVPIT